MDAEFKDVQQVFAEHRLLLPMLNVLIPDTRLYETLSIQPRGDIAARDDFIGHADHAAAVSQFSDFLRLAVENDSDVVLSPEYSCPWEAMTQAVKEKTLPKSGKLWVLGCEAITRA